MEIIIHDRVMRSKRRNETLALLRWNPVLKRLEVWSLAKCYWQPRGWLTLTFVIRNGFRMVKWIKTWAEPVEEM